MKYLCLHYIDEKRVEALSPDEIDALVRETFAYHDELRSRGHFVAGEALKPSRTATTVRVRSGRTSATDGPFAETNEQIGGITFIEARDLNEAIQIVARIPCARFGSVEVRPVEPLERP